MHSTAVNMTWLSGWLWAADCVFTARFEQVNVETSILITKFENLIVS